MKLKLFIVACMFIILASADILDVEYGDNDDEESVENNEIVTEIPVQSSMDSNEEMSDNTGEIEPQTCSRFEKIYKDHEVFHLGENDCEVCQCKNGEIECNADECAVAVDDDIFTSKEPMTEVEKVRDENIEEIKDDVKEDVEYDVEEEVKDDVIEEFKVDTNDASEDIVEEDIITESDIEIETTTNEFIEQQPQSSENVHENQQPQSSENVHENQQPQSSENVHENQQPQSSENVHDNQHHQSLENVHENQHHQSSENVHDNQYHQSSENVHENQHHQSSENVHENQHHQSSENVHENQHQKSSENVHENQQSQDLQENQQHQSSENVHDNHHHQSLENVHENQHHQSFENVYENQQSQNLNENQHHQSSENFHDNQHHQSSENVHENQHHQSFENVYENQQSQNLNENQHHQSSENFHDNQHHQSSENVHENQHHQSLDNVHENQHHQSSENVHENQHHESFENVHENQQSQDLHENQHHQNSENVHENQQSQYVNQQSQDDNQQSQYDNQHHQSSDYYHDNHQTYYHESPVIGAHSMQSNNNDHYNENEIEYDDIEEEKHELPNYYDLPGQYCARKFPRTSNGKCCDDRSDSCSVPILSTLCYCDEFCDKHNNPDCCPDYQSHCKGAPSRIITCEVDGVYFSPFDPPQMINCNSCKCQHDGKALCEIDSCLSNTEMIQNINYAQDISWTAKNYSQFFGRKYNEGLELRLGTFEPIRRVKAMSRLSNNQKQLPNRFNSLERWPGLISEVRDQGWCGSSWAVSTASVASDRFSVKSKGQEMVEMAPQQLLSCAKRQQGCNGGHLDIAWNYFRRWGGVDEDCYPYLAKVTNCRVPDKRASTLRSLGCSLPTKVARTDLYKMGPAYSLNNETDIMSEIFHHGPVQATMRVHHDFFTYQTGVYSHTSFGADQRSGFHSVRLIGWGQEDNGYENLKYWIAANSWGKWWGEKGFFRILRGTNECEIENYVLSSLADIQDTKVNGRRGRNSRNNRH